MVLDMLSSADYVILDMYGGFGQIGCFIITSMLFNAGCDLGDVRVFGPISCSINSSKLFYLAHVMQFLEKGICICIKKEGYMYKILIIRAEYYYQILLFSLFSYMSL